MSIYLPLILYRIRNKIYSGDHSKAWHRVISLFLIGLCAAMCALGVFALKRNLQINNFAEWFIAGYMIIFAVLLFTYELLWWCTVPSLNRLIRKNFGFMYKVRGKALYLIFVSCLCIGIDKKLLLDMDWLRYFSGIGWGATGVFLLVLSFTKPELFDNYYIPTKGFKEPGSNAGVNETV